MILALIDGIPLVADNHREIDDTVVEYEVYVESESNGYMYDEWVEHEAEVVRIPFIYRPIPRLADYTYTWLPISPDSHRNGSDIPF